MSLIRIGDRLFTLEGANLVKASKKSAPGQMGLFDGWTEEDEQKRKRDASGKFSSTGGAKPKTVAGVPVMQDVGQVTEVFDRGVQNIVERINDSDLAALGNDPEEWTGEVDEEGGPYDLLIDAVYDYVDPSGEMDFIDLDSVGIDSDAMLDSAVKSVEQAYEKRKEDLISEAASTPEAKQYLQSFIEELAPDLYGEPVKEMRESIIDGLWNAMEHPSDIQNGYGAIRNLELMSDDDLLGAIKRGTRKQRSRFVNEEASKFVQRQSNRLNRELNDLHQTGQPKSEELEGRIAQLRRISNKINQNKNMHKSALIKLGNALYSVDGDLNLIKAGTPCGRGWEGTKPGCKRKSKGGSATAARGGGVTVVQDSPPQSKGTTKKLQPKQKPEKKGRDNSAYKQFKSAGIPHRSAQIAAKLTKKKVLTPQEQTFLNNINKEVARNSR